MFDRFVPFHPLDFFQLKMKLAPFNGKFLKVHQLPSLHEEKIAKLSAGWSAQGLHIQCEAKVPLSQAQFPEFTSGDVLELLIDCRDNKQGFQLSRYCHHFVCFGAPVEYEGKPVHAVEVTRFRGEESHPLCAPEKIEVEVVSAKKLQIFLPQEILVGFDPTQFPRIGFSYILRTHTELEQTIGASLEDFAIEQRPSLWPSFDLIP